MKGTEQLILIGAKSSGELLRISQQTILVHARGLQDSVSRTRQRGWHDRAGGSRGCNKGAQAAAACRCIQEARSSKWAVESAYGGPGYRPLSSERLPSFPTKARRLAAVFIDMRPTSSHTIILRWQVAQSGRGIPVAAGAAVACPDRKVVCLHGDGGAMYTLQALWTQARESLDVATVIFANRSYAILNIELARASEREIPDRGPFQCSICTIPNLIGSSLLLVWASRRAAQPRLRNSRHNSPAQ